MCEIFKNVENNIKFNKGDIIVSNFMGYNDDNYYVAISNYAWYACDDHNNCNKYKLKQVHQNNFDYKEVFLFGGWKVNARSIKTGKYKLFKQEDVSNIEETYLRFIPGHIRDVRLSCIL